MGRHLCLAAALMFVGCAKSKSADKTAVEPGPSGGAVGAVGGGVAPKQDEKPADTQTTVTTDTAAHTPLPPDDLTPKGGDVPHDTASGGGGSKNTESMTKPKDARELGKSSAALGTTDHGELFEQLAVKVASAKLGAKPSTELSTAVAGKTTDLDACYANARKTNTKLAGKLELLFSVDADGNVSSVTVKSSTVKSKDLETCVKDVAKLVKVDKSLITTKTTKASVVIEFGS